MRRVVLGTLLLSLMAVGAAAVVEAAESQPRWLAPEAISSPVPAASHRGPNPDDPGFIGPSPSGSCRVCAVCRCGQVLICTSASGDCHVTPGCAVMCDGEEQVCPPCNGFACA